MDLPSLCSPHNMFFSEPATMLSTDRTFQKENIAMIQRRSDSSAGSQHTGHIHKNLLAKHK